MKYIINNKEYKVHYEYSPEDDLYEVDLKDPDGKVWASGVGETKGEATRELQERLGERGIKPGVPNTYIAWEDLAPEDRRKIQVRMKTLKHELSGEWMTEEERYQRFRSQITQWTTKEYGYTTPPTYGDYRGV